MGKIIFMLEAFIEIKVEGIDERKIGGFNMPDYRMDIRGKLGLGEYSDIYDYMGIVDKNDKFTITLDSSNRQYKNIITSMLKEGNFIILEEGVDLVGDYYISANKYK